MRLLGALPLPSLCSFGQRNLLIFGLWLWLAQATAEPCARIAQRVGFVDFGNVVDPIEQVLKAASHTEPRPDVSLLLWRLVREHQPPSLLDGDELALIVPHSIA